MVVVGDPRAEGVRMGPLASRDQRREVLSRIDELRREAEIGSGALLGFRPPGAGPGRGAFGPPVLLRGRAPARARAIHAVEAFGPVATVVPCSGVEDAIALARKGEGSLAGSVFTADDAVAARLVLGLAPFHGRVLVVNRHCAEECAGHG